MYISPIHVNMMRSSLLVLFAATTVVSGLGEPSFPLNETVEAAFKALHNAPAPEPTGFNSTTYLETIKGIVDFFRQHQATDGSIIDPYENKEIQ